MVWPFQNKVNEQDETYKLNAKLDQDAGMQNPGAIPPEDTAYLADQPKRDDFTKWTQELDPELQEIAFDLKRYFYNSNTETWVQEKGPDGKAVIPMANDFFIKKMITSLKSLSSKNLINSNFDNDNISIELRSIYIQFICDLGYNLDKYNIDKGDMSYIVRLFKNRVKPSFYRALNDGERRHIRSYYKDIHTSGERIETQKKKSMFNLGG